MTGPLRDDLRFDLAGHGVRAELATGGEAGLVLNLELQGTRHVFARGQIALQALGIGTLVTVELERWLNRTGPISASCYPACAWTWSTAPKI